MPTLEWPRLNQGDAGAVGSCWVSVGAKSLRQACKLMGIDRSSMRYRSRRAGDAVVQLRILSGVASATVGYM